MKRRYKAGDWLRIPLGGDSDALAIITRACRSRLFGYFFAYPASQTPVHEELRALRPGSAMAMMLFGGSPIEHGRWPMIATSLAFDQAEWPFPEFASRGAFGDAWTCVRYDPQTLQIIERTPTTAEHARHLTDARIADAHEVESALRRRLAGEATPIAESICEIRSPFDAARLQAAAHGGTVQFSTPLNRRDLEELRAFTQAHPAVRLRVHGFRHGFDAHEVAGFDALRDLALDVHRLQHADALKGLQSLRRLRIGAMQADLAFLSALPNLETLELRGTRASLAPLERCTALRDVALGNTPPIDFARLASAKSLQTLTLSHGQYDLETLGALTELRRLELHSLDAAKLPQLDRFAHLETLVLRELHAITDLSPLTLARSLRELQIGGMPQLNVADFAPLAACAGLRNLRVDIGSRRKQREIYALLRFGNR